MPSLTYVFLLSLVKFSFFLLFLPCSSSCTEGWGREEAPQGCGQASACSSLSACSMGAGRRVGGAGPAVSHLQLGG